MTTEYTYVTYRPAGQPLDEASTHGWFPTEEEARSAAEGTNNPNATIVRLEKADDATLALQTGRVDVQVLVWLLALNVLKKNPSLGTMIVPMPLEATSTNIAVPKEDDKAWLETINKWIEAERAAGKIKTTVLQNLQKLSGVRPEDVPPQIPL